MIITQRIIIMMRSFVAILLLCSLLTVARSRTLLLSQQQEIEEATTRTNLSPIAIFSRRKVLQTDTAFCTRENVLYASLIGCGSMQEFYEDDVDRKNACCLILAQLNQEKCFCENKVATLLEAQQANFVSMFVSSYEFCNGLEIFGGWKCARFPREMFLFPPPPAVSAFPPYPPLPPSSTSPSSTATSSSLNGGRPSIDVCAIAGSPEALIAQNCDKLTFLKEGGPLSLLTRCCEQINILNDNFCFCDENRFNQGRTFYAMFSAVPIKCRNVARMQIYYGPKCDVFDGIGTPSSPPPSPFPPRAPIMIAPQEDQEQQGWTSTKWSNVQNQNNNNDDLLTFWRTPAQT